MSQPIVGITADIQVWNDRRRCTVTTAYTQAIADAGATPILLPPLRQCIEQHIQLCHAFVLTGGDDPRTEPFGVKTHPQAVPVDPERQDYESALIDSLNDHHPHRPVLGVCLGMQMMTLHAGGSLNQHLPDTHDTHASHWNSEHEITPTMDGHFAHGTVHSRHRQAVENPGRLSVLATAPDGIIEAVADPDRPFYLGVQWHPERTSDAALGRKIFQSLVLHARSDSA